MYTHGEVAALRDALQEGLSISSAVSRAREALSADTGALVGALGAFELERADIAMEAAIALRTVERSVDEVLLPSLQEIGGRYGYDSAPWAFAARWARDWLLRAQRLAPPPNRGVSILIGDANAHELEYDALAMRALELFCARAGARVLPLSVTAMIGLEDVLTAIRPDAVVVAGGHVADDDVARWAYGVRSVAGALPLSLFRRGERGRTTGAVVLDDTPSEAHEEILALVDGQVRTRESAPRPIEVEAPVAIPARRWIEA